ncbi:(deoxy)nucleoside triphosphate pyrophosphohydrolase [Nocardioides houyundeii]|uniref:(deoxy)nucleoside triphosphate pyrophosphohydrolase n=1 Tax=Nocardioides houyundeii TaxID=2045452 RepID=UPI001F52BA8B|nr:(deoxy)nucleoside triphosphate pyrophosphohydrolase [Nocardioides houyundeii]
MALVVGAAIVDRGRVLAARRTQPAAAAGRWEFPGGKVEDGEAPDEALVREIAEELECGIEVSTWLDPVVPLPGGHELSVAVAWLVRGVPVPLEHDELRWLSAAELDSVDWLEADRPFLAELAEVLSA